MRAVLSGLCSAFLVLQPLAAAPVWASPQGMKVVRGKVKVRERGNKTVIKASNRAIIKYKSFDIAPGEKVRFVQPGRNARVLNRVTGPGATRIDGALSANGRVYIVNKQGVRIGEAAIVNVGGLMAAAGDISDSDFVAGVDHFVDLEGSVENHGEIVADEAMLIGRYVENQGVVLSDDGLITMVAGQDVYIGRHGDAVLVKIDASDMADAGRAGVEQAGIADAGDGQVVLGAGDLYSLAVRVPGEVRAHRIGVEGQGSGRVEVSGRLDARSADGQGGEIRVLGEDVALEGADADASGATGGGRVLVGGAYQGAGPERNAETTLVDAETTLSADATRKGDGGEIVVWADDTATIHGGISARGAGGGRGGSVETSGKEGLVLTTAPSLGEGGQWLIDPRDLAIVADGTGTTGIDDNASPTPAPVPPTSTTGEFRASSPSATLEVGLLLQALTDGADVTVFTGGGTSGGNQPGDLTVATPIDYDGTGSNTLRLLARNDVIVDVGSTISDSAPGDGDLLNLELAGDIGTNNARNAGDGNGDVLLRASIETNGGFFESSGQQFVLGDGGNTADVTTGAGDITLDHLGTVSLETGALSASGGTIDITASEGTSDIGVVSGSLVTSNGSSVALAAGRDIDLSAAGDLAIDGGLRLDAGRDVVLAAAGDQTLDAGSGVLETSNDLVKAAGDLTLSGSGISLTRNASDQVLEATAGALVLTAGVAKSNEGTLDLRGGSGIRISGDVAGTSTDTGNTGVVLADDVTLEGVGLDQRIDGGAGTLRIAGDVSKAVAGGFTLASSSASSPEIRLNGSGEQVLNAGPGVLTLESDLVKNAEGKVRLRGAQVAAAGDITGYGGVVGDPTTVGVVVETGLDLTGAARQTVDGGTGALELQADLGKSAGADGLVLAAGDGLVLNDAVAQELGSGSGTLETDLDIVKGGVETLTLTGGGVDLTRTGAQQIDAGGALVIDTSVAKTGAGTLTLDGASLSLSGDATGSGDIVLGTDLALTGASTQTIDATGGTLHVPGDIVKGGGGTAGGFALDGAVALEGAGVDQTLDAGDGTLGLGGNVSKTVAGGYTLLGSDVALNGAGAQSLSAGQDAITVGSALAPIDVAKTTEGGLTLDAPDVVLYGDVTSSQGLTLASGSSIDLLGAGLQSLDAGTGVLDVQVDLAKVGSGGFSLGGDGGIAFSAAGGQSASAAGQTLALTDSASKSGGGLLTLTADAIELGGGVQGDADASGVEFDGDVALTGVGVDQQLDGNGGTLAFSGDVSKAVSGGYTLKGSDVALVGAADQTVSADLDSVTVGSAGSPVAIAKTPATGALVLGGNRVALSATTSAESLVLDAATTDLIANGAQTLESTASPLQVGGDIVSTGSGIKTLTGAGVGVVFDGAGDQGASASAGGTLSLPVAVAKTTPGVLTLGGGLVAIGTQASGSDGLRFAGDVVLTQAGVTQTLDGGSGALAFEGDVAKSVAGGYSLQGSQVLLDGGGAQTIRADQDTVGIGSALSPVDVVKTSAGGLTLDAPDVEIHGDVSSDAGLTLASGSVFHLLGAAPQSLDAGSGVLDVQVDLDKSGAGGLALAGGAGIHFSAAGDQSVTAAGQTLTLGGPVSKTAAGGLELQASEIDVADDVTGDSGVRFAGDVVLTGAGVEQMLDAGSGALVFEGNASKAVAGGYALVGTQVTMDGATDQSLASGPGAVRVGSGASPVDLVKTAGTGALALTGSATVLSGDVVADSLALDAATTEISGGADQTLQTRTGDLSVGGNVSATGGGDVWLTAAGALVFDGAGDQRADAGTGVLHLVGASATKTTLGDLTLDGAGVSAQTDVAASQGSLAFDADTTATGDLSASDGLVFAGSLALAGAAVQTVDGGIGGIQAHDVTGSNPVGIGFQSTAGTDIAGDLVTTSGSVSVQGDLVLGGDASVQDGIAVTGDMRVTGPGTRTVDTVDGVLDVAGSLDAPDGALHVVRNLQVDGDVTTDGLLTLDEGATLGGVVSAVGIDAGATLVLTSIGDVVLDTKGGDLEIAGGDLLADNASRLTLQTSGSGALFVPDGQIRSAGDLSIQSPLTAKDVHVGDDALFDAPTTITGSVETAGNVRFRQSIELQGDVEAGGRVRFGDDGVDLTGKGAQHIQAGTSIASRGTIAKTTGGTLTLKARDGIELSHRVTAKRDLVLDGFDPSGGPPQVATVYNRSGDLAIRSKQGSIRIEGDERISSPHGNLTLRAENGQITVGDLSAFQQVSVTSPDIAIRSRSGGTVITATGIAQDRGPDIVARSVVFSSRPQGAGNLNVATPSGQPVSETLSGATVRTLEETFDSTLLVSNDGSTAYDPAASGTVRTNLGGVIAAESASLFTEQTALLQSLNQVAVSAKPLWASEVVAFLECGLYDADDPDLPAECEGYAAEDQGSQDERFQSASAKSALETYRFIFGQVDDIRDAFQQAADDYERETGGQPLEGSAFRSYLEANRASHEQALGYFDRLADLFGQMEAMGLGGSDFQEARELLLDEVAPTDMEAVELDDAIRGAEHVEPGGPGQAFVPLFAGAPLPGVRKWWEVPVREDSSGR